ncbi:C-Maf-inducing protein-like isoform X2 [Ornithodoros turicata]|uniref:C-Maf-inducing protein-like isoform X2 n=1 Tax=Ornithodoros turicata TaxID=34597 RepID=UPI003138EE0D
MEEHSCNCSISTDRDAARDLLTNDHESTDGSNHVCVSGAQTTVGCCSTSNASELPTAVASTSGECPETPSSTLSLPVNCHNGTKFQLIHEGDIQLCRLNHNRTVISKILSSKFLRRWETHRIVLGASEMSSTTTGGFMERPVSYGSVEDVYPLLRWDPNHKYCLRVVIPEGSLLLQAANSYVRDQWLHSICWKKALMKYKRVLLSSRKREVVLKELRGLINLTLSTPLQDRNIYQQPMDIISKFLVTSKDWLQPDVVEDVIRIILPLLERTTPTAELCEYFCKHCKRCPQSRVVFEMYTPVVQRILKHNMDFGKNPMTRLLVQEYVQALNTQKSGYEAIADFVRSVHGEGSTCPHPRVLPNLVATVLAGVFALFEGKRSTKEENALQSESDWEARHDCFVKILDICASYDDWLLTLAQLLQPVPFPDDALGYAHFTAQMEPIVVKIGTDTKCEVHSLVLGAREGKDGWLQLYSPGSVACRDEGILWSRILGTLVRCCCRRRAFLAPLSDWLGPLTVGALRGNISCQHVLCAMLELEALEPGDKHLQAAAALEAVSCPEYHALCHRQGLVQKLQQKGGPRTLAMPSRSTDADLEKLLSGGSFGNLECLSLAFTQVTSACAEHIIKLPSLRYLNLWSTQFGDSGLKLISEHLPMLQVLNLCETPVTDNGLTSLESMKSLRKLNLNSTGLSAEKFECLKEKLPALQECDVCYTDAW